MRSSCVWWLVFASLVLACGSESESPDPDGTPITEPEPEPEPQPANIRLGLNDVSVLYPLPANADEPGYLSPTDVGSHGELFPRSIYDQIPEFPVVTESSLVYVRLRAVGVRFDGCGGGPNACLPELRLVLQPVNDDGTARDSALHLFYRLTEEAMAEAVIDLRRLRALAPEVADAPLDVHAALVAQGVTGAYGAGLRELVLRHAGDDNLVRMTFFLRAPPVAETWFFGGFEREEGTLSVMNIVGVGAGNQRVIRTEIVGGYQYDLLPVGDVPEDGSAFYSSALAEQATTAQRSETMASYLRVENPALYVPDQLPCAGCHMATYVTAQASANFGLEPAMFPEDAFVSELDLALRGNAASTPSSLRAFGYFEDEVMIAQRTVNESAAVVVDLEQRYPEQPLLD